MVSMTLTLAVSLGEPKKVFNCAISRGAGMRFEAEAAFPSLDFAV